MIPHTLTGLPASPGLAVGAVVQVRHASVEVVERAQDAEREHRALEEALERAKSQIAVLQSRLKAEADAGQAAIFAAHAQLLDDPELLTLARRLIVQGKSAGFAWQQAYTAQAGRLARLRNELLAARANDLRDIGARVLRLLAGATIAETRYPPNAVLVAPDITPSDTATLDRSTVLGFCTVAGGATSHVAILARSLGIPAVAGIDPRALDVPDGTPVLLDGTRGVLHLHPSSDEIDRARRSLERQAARRARDVADAHAPACTADGHRVEVAANIRSRADADEAVALGADAVGLLRSEFLFLGRACAPSEDDQAAAYEAVARVLGPDRPLVVRLLDVGGDKPLPYLPGPREDNPSLGERGVRLLLRQPEVLRPHLRALLRASLAGPVRVMVPMVSTLDEWRGITAAFEQERARLGVPRVPLGMMVEVPAAAILADQFAPEVDFFSIGTNDLAQYTLAMDRGHPALASQVDSLQPAVLHLVARTVDAAHRHGKRVAVCGGIAGDAQAVPILVGLGVDELSVAVPEVPIVKARVRTLTLADCRTLAERALAAATATAVRALSPVPVDDPWTP